VVMERTFCSYGAGTILWTNFSIWEPNNAWRRPPASLLNEVRELAARTAEVMSAALTPQSTVHTVFKKKDLVSLIQ